MLDILEARHDWAKMVFTPELFKHVLTQLIPDVLWHSKSQDEEQVRDHYDRKQRVFSRIDASLIFLLSFQESMTSTDGALVFPERVARIIVLKPVIQVPWPPHDLHLRHRH